MVFLLLLVGATAFAEDKKADKKAPPPPAPPAAKADKITGEVVDITCLSSRDAHGDKHAACAAKCLAAGMPAGLLAGGKLYIVTMKDHTAPNAKLAAWAGKEVTATGSIIVKDGAHIFEIDTVEPAAPPPVKK